MFGLLLAAALSTIFANSCCIVAAEEQGTGVVILKPDGKLVARVEVGRWPHEVEVSSDGTTAFVSQFGITDYDSRIGTPGDHVSRIDLAAARETGRFTVPDGVRAAQGSKLRPGRDEIFVNAEAGGDTM